MTKPRKRRMTIVGIIALAVMALWIGIIVASIDDWSRDWSTNHAEITVDAIDPDLRSPALTESPEDIATRIEVWVDAQSQWKLESKAVEEGGITMQLVRTTRIFRFADDILVRLHSVDGATRLTAESRSRVGKGDLGQNPRNLKELLRGLR